MTLFFVILWQLLFQTKNSLAHKDNFFVTVVKIEEQLIWRELFLRTKLLLNCGLYYKNITFVSDAQSCGVVLMTLEVSFVIVIFLEYIILPDTVCPWQTYTKTCLQGMCLILWSTFGRHTLRKSLVALPTNAYQFEKSCHRQTLTYFAVLI
jgi:hypothetical protein